MLPSTFTSDNGLKQDEQAARAGDNWQNDKSICHEYWMQACPGTMWHFWVHTHSLTVRLLDIWSLGL